MSADDCECWSPHAHRPFCPARVAEVPCIGLVVWRPNNVQCVACGKFGQSCDRSSSKAINALIEKSSLGAAMRDIKERGIDAHAADLAREMRPMRRKKR